MMKRRIGTASILAALAFLTLATAGFAQTHVVPHPPTAPAPVHTIAPVATPMPMPTFQSAPVDPNKARYVHRVEPGTQVPLSRLPRIPHKTIMNTMIAKTAVHGGHYHPMSASGATLTATPQAACVSGGTLGALFNVGCALSLTGNNMNLWQSAGTDVYQYYAITPTTPNVATAIAGCATWSGNTGGACNNASTTLSIQGTYEFLIYDTTQQVWVTAFFANAGQVFSIQVYQDAFHTSQAYQFDTTTSNAAYVYLTNVAPSGSYVMYVQSTGVNVYCVFMSPSGTAPILPPSPRPTGGAAELCNPSKANVTGNPAPGGNLSLVWGLSPNDEGGLYTVSIFDQNANGGVGAVLGSVQVSLTSGGSALLTTGSITGMNPSPAPYGPTGTYKLAWDASTDQAVGGITAKTSDVIPASTYQWTLTDPDGQVLSAPAKVVLGSQGTLTTTFNFTGLGMNPPGQYPSTTWGLELYDVTHNSVIASQAYQVIGYHATTTFIAGGVSSNVINFTGTGGVQNIKADLKIVNDGNLIYGVGDSFSGMEFTEAPQTKFSTNFKPPTVCTGACGAFSGVTWALNNGGIENCGGAAGCNETVADSNGNNWTITNYCTTQPSSNPGFYDYCVMTILPVNSGTTLPVGASIDIPNIIWYGDLANNTFPCWATPCYGTTTVLPTDGLSWSATNNLANPTAWTPVAFGSQNSGITLGGTMRVDYAGSGTCGAAPTYFNATQGQVPWTEAHYFQPAFTRADYQLSTPYALAAARCNVLSVLVTNTSTGAPATDLNFADGGAGYPMLQIGFPSYFTTSQIVVDSHSTATWTKVACPSSLGPTFVCLNPNPTTTTIAGNGGTATIYLDVPLTVSSFAFQELQVQAFSSDFVTVALTNDGTNTVTAYGYQGTPTTTLDSMKIGVFSLNPNLMTSAFTPSTVGSGQNPTPLTIVIGNASLAADPNPDAIDEIVLEQTTNKNWIISGSPTVTGPTAWSYLTTFNPSGNTLDYYFGECAAQAVQADGPPQTTGVSYPLSAAYPSPPPCTNAQKANALIPGGTATINMSLVTAGGIAAGTYNFNVYAHGANSGGWTQLKAFTLTVNNETASAGFQSVGTTCPGTAVPVNSLPTVGKQSNCFVYEVKNTSASSSIGTVDITIPAFDINSLAANSWSLNGSPITTNIVLGTITGGVFTAGAPAGCTINAANTFQPVGGTTNGQIEVHNCTGVTAGKNLAVEFQATSPGLQSDTYNFPSKVDGIPTSPTWIGDQQVQESFSIGLTVVVNPSNPGPGGSTPVVACASCAFAGSTIDFGPIANGGSSIGTNVVRATVIYNGATTGTNWQLQLGVSGANPACTGAAPNCTASGSAIPFELLTDADKTIANGGHSNTQCGTLTPQQTTFAAVPTTGAPMTLSIGSETACGNPPPPFWDTIQNYIVQVGTESPIAHSIQVVYTLIP